MGSRIANRPSEQASEGIDEGERSERAFEPLATNPSRTTTPPKQAPGPDANFAPRPRRAIAPRGIEAAPRTSPLARATTRGRNPSEGEREFGPREPRTPPRFSTRKKIGNAETRDVEKREVSRLQLVDRIVVIAS